MKKIISLLIVATALFAVACGSSEPYVYEEPVSVDSLNPTVSGTAIVVECISDQWVCTEEYGGSINTVEAYAGMIQVSEMFSGFDTTDIQVEYLLQEESWVGSEVTDEYSFSNGEVAVVEGASNGKTRWLLMKSLDGKTDYSIKCEATIDTGLYESHKASIEAMCDAVHAE